MFCILWVLEILAVSCNGILLQINNSGFLSSVEDSVESNLLLFCFTTPLCDLFAKLAPLSQPKPKPFHECLHAFSRAWRRLHISASNSDRFIALSASRDWPERLLWFWFYDTHLIPLCQFSNLHTPVKLTNSCWQMQGGCSWKLLSNLAAISNSWKSVVWK